MPAMLLPSGNRTGFGLGLYRIPARFTNNPSVTGADLGRYIVDSYISEDQRIVDDQARAELRVVVCSAHPPRSRWQHSLKQHADRHRFAANTTIS